MGFYVFSGGLIGRGRALDSITRPLDKGATAGDPATPPLSLSLSLSRVFVSFGPFFPPRLSKMSPRCAGGHSARFPPSRWAREFVHRHRHPAQGTSPSSRTPVGRRTRRFSANLLSINKFFIDRRTQMNDLMRHVTH